MKLHNLSLADKKVFAKYLKLSEHKLSVYSFQNIYIWKKLFAISWAIIDGSLFVFFRDKIGCFSYLGPLGAAISPSAISKAFEAMDKCNKNKEISRIENIEAKDIQFYRELGLDCRLKAHDYLCRRLDLAGLKGNKFKSKRSSYNYFTKHYDGQYKEFPLSRKDSCLELFSLWMKQRKEGNSDVIYQGMIEDSASCLKILLDNYKKLNLYGRIVIIDNKVKAFTFGYPLNKDTFCILYEITDLSIKGLAQFIFRAFCRELKDYRYINVMDDSGLENLKKVKLSYHPLELVPAYTAKRKNA